MPPDRHIDSLATRARRFLPRAHVPYSGRPAAAAALLSDGDWVPGVRVESASFGLTVPAVVNAVTAAYAAGRRDVVAIALAGPEPPMTEAWIRGLPGDWMRTGPGFACGDLPALRFRLDFFDDTRMASRRDLRALAARAWVPESGFRVSCYLLGTRARAIPGVNVEHPDWMGILCAERNALSTAVTFGALPARTLWLHSPDDPGVAPCGACRQLLAELAPDTLVDVEGRSAAGKMPTAAELLPGAFRGEGLRRAR